MNVKGKKSKYNMKGDNNDRIKPIFKLITRKKDNKKKHEKERIKWCWGDNEDNSGGRENNEKNCEYEKVLNGFETVERIWLFF